MAAVRHDHDRRCVMHAALVLALVLTACLPVAAEPRKGPESPGTAPRPSLSMQAHMALRAAGANAQELWKALEAVAGDKDRYAAMHFLVENMPRIDLESLSREFLVTTVDYAVKARRETPWGRTLSDERFFCDVLPYASLNERRDDWRADFYTRCMPLVADCKTAGEAAIKLNTTIYDVLGVRYHATKRPKPDQSPYESIEVSYASCTGLSILLVDACRAVGVPARIAGVPEWTGAEGNHTWVEVWDDGWHAIGAAESAALGEVWFAGAAAKADASDPMKRIYASSFKRLPLRFPLVWDPYISYVSAVDVTARYKGE